jgi:transcriptional regulator with XRE-family HTH domain
MLAPMDDQRIGRTIRALRHRLGWRQVDVARRARGTQDDVSRVERGRIGTMTVDKVRRLAAALDAELVLTLRWRGGEVDRLMDEGHAALVGWIVSILVDAGWEAQAEVSYAISGERGSIDVLAWHASTRTLLVVEVKTELTSLEETLRKHDAKQRLAAEVAQARFRWSGPGAVCRLLVLPALTTPRRHVAKHAAVLDRAYRLRGTAAREWLNMPGGSASALVFAPLTHGARRRRGGVSRRRIRVSSVESGSTGGGAADSAKDASGA